MSYAKDPTGFHLGPQEYGLEGRLGYIAAAWRTTYDENLVAEYHKTMKRLYELGWDDTLDFESLLPDELMPQEFMDRQNKKIIDWQKRKEIIEKQRERIIEKKPKNEILQFLYRLFNRR
jgi:hypothetical protein